MVKIFQSGFIFFHFHKQWATDAKVNVIVLFFM